MMVWANVTFDVLSTALIAFSPLRTSPLARFAPCTSLTGPPHPLLLFGALSTIIGAALRLACFRALGRLFTFELTIDPTHTLITTGPYAALRHPSYTGVYLTLLGASAVALAPGSWLVECGLGLSAEADAGAVLVWALLGFWIVKVYYALSSTNARIVREDRELKKVFGTEWDKYAERVPWRLVPWVW